jgi:transposase
MVYRNPLLPLSAAGREQMPGRSLYNVAPLYLAVGDQLDALLSELDLEDLQMVGEGQSGFVMAMVTIFQFFEGLSDEQAADALRTRLEWKYALHLPLDHPGLDPLELGAFRQRLGENAAVGRAFQTLLARLEAVGLWRRGAGVPPLTTESLLSSVRALNRLGRVVETMRATVQALAASYPEWLLTISPPYWYDRYSSQSDRDCLPTTSEQQKALMRAVRADIALVIEAIEKAGRAELAALPQVHELQEVWQQECRHCGGEN